MNEPKPLEIPSLYETLITNLSEGELGMGEDFGALEGDPHEV